MATPSLADLQTGSKVSLAAAFAAVEVDTHSEETLALLTQTWGSARAQVIGVTGPPGVGKSTLIGRLIKAYRSDHKTVGVIAVDPSSRLSGGALLGDRTRIETDPEDEAVFIRSMAARDQLGGLAFLTRAGITLMRAVFDIVIVETVGVGQSETDIADYADTIVFCVQPGSGDALQFMKAGIAEVPHIAVVTKSDLGKSASKAQTDVAGALSLASDESDGWVVPVLMTSSQSDESIRSLMNRIEDHWQWLAQGDRLNQRRRMQAQHWVRRAILDRFGREGVRQAGAGLTLKPGESPFERELILEKALNRTAN